MKITMSAGEFLTMAGRELMRRNGIEGQCEVTWKFENQMDEMTGLNTMSQVTVRFEPVVEENSDQRGEGGLGRVLEVDRIEEIATRQG